MITLFLFSMQLAHSGIFSSSPSHKEQSRQEILNKLKVDVGEALAKRRTFELTYRQKNHQYEQQNPVLDALSKRAENLLSELQKDDLN